MTRQPLRLALLEAERVLAAAGVPSPRVDAELLASHVVGVERGRLMMVPLVDPAVVERDGLEGDRRWGIRDGRTGRILTARRRPELLHAAATYRERRPDVSVNVARRFAARPLFRAGLMVKRGDADALVAGAATPTAA